MEGHDRDIIENINKDYGKKDTLYVLGDFAYKNHVKYIHAIKPKIIFIKGNHDKASQEVYRLFAEVHDFGCDKFIATKEQLPNGKFKKESVTLCHYALRAWNRSCHGSICLYGHSHGRMPEFDNWVSFGVGLDIWGYTPVNFDVVMEKVRMIRQRIKELELNPGDGESRPIGVYDKDPDQRMLDVRAKNKQIVVSMGLPIDEKMWPTVLYPDQVA